MITTLQPAPSLSVLRRLIVRQKHANEDLHNVIRSMLKPETKIEYQINHRSYFGKVVEVIGVPGRTQIRVVNLSTFKQRDIRPDDITGLVQEE